MAWKLGQKLQDGKYTIEQELEQGCFAITYLAKDEDGHKLVIKTLNEDKLKRLPPVERDNLKCKFVDEARKLECCKHPHVVGVQKTFIEGQQFCLAMEYVGGDTLASLTHRVLPEKQALRYIQQIGEALMAAHRQSLLHRDVKPANIRVRSGQSQAVLTNFDLIGEWDYPLTASWRDEPFAPIELASAKICRGTCTDVYSLAATLYVLLTGQLPASAVVRQKHKVNLIPPKEINPQISQRVNDAIMKGMRLAPETRPQTMREWLDLLGLKRGRAKSKLLGKQPRWVMLVEILGVVGVLAAMLSTRIDVMALWEKYVSPSLEKVTPSAKSQMKPSEVIPLPPQPPKFEG
ncbi:MAG TPA: serine/threonine protein kinase, partial [Cyanobacteria bacterium UBA8803]|nr:serine/threonine protein kinase [Cyanobacteria bacterium UBA8803]